VHYHRCDSHIGFPACIHMPIMGDMPTHSCGLMHIMGIAGRSRIFSVKLSGGLRTAGLPGDAKLVIG
jgi:hypothetical protein